MLRVVVAALILGLAFGLGVLLVRSSSPSGAASSDRSLRTAGSAPPLAPTMREQTGESKGVEQTQPEDAGIHTSESEDRLSEALCPAGMALVAGQRCGGWERACAERSPGSGHCVRYAERARCRAFGDAVRYCIDRDEYPNVPGMLPALLVTFEQSREACEAEGKRLCSEDEWTFACEGPAGHPFSYGLAWRPDACNIGALDARPAAERFWNSHAVSALVARHDHRRPIASSSACRSPFGVRDLVGNVAEWVVSTAAGADLSAVKGGDFTDSAADCRGVLKIRAKNYRAFPVGFRCCRDTFAHGGR